MFMHKTLKINYLYTIWVINDLHAKMYSIIYRVLSYEVVISGTLNIQNYTGSSNLQFSQ